MGNYHLAIDIGASSGRHILGQVREGKLCLEEIHRFANGMVQREGHLVWDLPALWKEICAGLAKCKELGKIPASLSIDTWGVDYVLLDSSGELLGEAYGYRDARTKGTDAILFSKISEEELYARGGIQKQSFNTIYQLLADQRDRPELLAGAEHLLMIPDYLQYLLTGLVAQEYSNASTSQLLLARSRDWDWELIERLGFPKKIFSPIGSAGQPLGALRKELKEQLGFDCQVILAASHDTASAVMAIPSPKEENLYLSSGTWSLMGTEQVHPLTTPEAMSANMTNEGGYGGSYRFLKNIMGLWMIQSIRREMAPELSFGELCQLANEETIESLVDVNEERFLSPVSMREAICQACWESKQEIPQTIGAFARVIYRSLADCYGRCACEIEALCGRSFDEIYLLGGGANADYLNQLTANATGKEVFAGPTEATAIGNLLAQLIAVGEIADLTEGRRLVSSSFEIRHFVKEEV